MFRTSRGIARCKFLQPLRYLCQFMRLTTAKRVLRNSFDINCLRKMCGTWVVDQDHVVVARRIRRASTGGLICRARLTLKLPDSFIGTQFNSSISKLRATIRGQTSAGGVSTKLRDEQWGRHDGTPLPAASTILTYSCRRSRGDHEHTRTLVEGCKVINRTCYHDALWQRL